MSFFKLIEGGILHQNKFDARHEEIVINKHSAQEYQALEVESRNKSQIQELRMKKIGVEESWKMDQRMERRTGEWRIKPSKSLQEYIGN